MMITITFWGTVLLCCKDTGLLIILWESSQSSYWFTTDLEINDVWNTPRKHASIRKICICFNSKQMN